MDRSTPHLNARSTLAVVAASLALLAALAGEPRPTTVDVGALAQQIATEADHVDATTVARWIKSRRSDLRIIDVREQSEYDEYHIPTAEHLPLERLTALARSSDTTVLYSGGGAHGAQAWVLLRALGHAKVAVLSGGIDEWTTEVLHPIVPPDAAGPQAAEAVDLAVYFGGTPRVQPRAIDETGSRSDRARAVPPRRRGC